MYLVNKTYLEQTLSFMKEIGKREKDILFIGIPAGDKNGQRQCSWQNFKEQASCTSGFLDKRIIIVFNDKTIMYQHVHYQESEWRSINFPNLEDFDRTTLKSIFE